MAVKFNVELACFLCVPTWLVAHVRFQISNLLSCTRCLLQKVNVQINSNQFKSIFSRKEPYHINQFKKPDGGTT